MTLHEGRGRPPAPPAVAPPPWPSDLAALARHRLDQTGDPAMLALACDERDGVVRLSGRLPSRDHLMRALGVVCALPGLRGLDNRVAVG